MSFILNSICEPSPSELCPSALQMQCEKQTLDRWEIAVLVLGGLAGKS